FHDPIGQTARSTVKTRVCLVAALALALLPSSGSAEAQPGTRTWHVGFLGAETPDTNQHFLDAFRDGMKAQGYVEGPNLVIEARWAEGNAERFKELAEELVRLKLDAIVAISTLAARAAKERTRAIPIVFIAVDPLNTGVVKSLARPGENVTGLSLALG